MDSLNQIRCFMAVVDCGGFSKAAKQRGATQGMISKAVASLEKQLGASLFHRSTRSVVPTEDGRLFYARCLPLIEELDEITQAMAGNKGNLRGELRVASPATFGRLHLAPLLPVLLARHPQMSLDVLLEDTRTDLVGAGIDVALRIGGQDRPNEVVRRLGMTRVCLVGSTDYFERHGVPTHPRDLVGRECLVYQSARAGASWRFAGPEGAFEVAVSGRLRANQMDAIRTAVAAGAGLAMMSEASLTEELLPPHSRSILENYIPWTLEVKAVWTKRRFVPAKVRLFVDFLAEQLPTRRGIAHV